MSEKATWIGWIAAIVALNLVFFEPAHAGATRQSAEAEEAERLALLRQDQLEQQIAKEKAQRKTRVSLDVAAAYFDRDVVNGFGATIDDTPFVFIRQPDDGHKIKAIGIKGGLGFVTPIKDNNWVLIGHLDGAWVEDDESFRLPLAANEYLDTLPINGAPSPGAIASGPVGFFPGADVDVSADSRFWRIGGFAGVGKECENKNRSSMLGIGLYGAYSELDFESVFNAALPGFNIPIQTPITTTTLVFDPSTESLIPVVTTSFIDDILVVDPDTAFLRKIENVQAWSVGPMAVGELGFVLTESVDFTLGGKLGALYVKGDLVSRQTATNLASELQVEDSAGKFAFLGEIKVGFDFNTTENITLSIFGSAEGRNDVIKIKNPRSDTGLVSNNPSSYNPGPAKLDQTVLFTAAIGGEITVAF